MQPIYVPDILWFPDIFTDSESKRQGCLKFRKIIMLPKLNNHLITILKYVNQNVSQGEN